jgi:hypothetical protein
MANNVAMFIFLGAAAASLFAFLSVAVWVGTQSQDRKARDRSALPRRWPSSRARTETRLDVLRQAGAAEGAFREGQGAGYLVGGLTAGRRHRPP